MNLFYGTTFKEHISALKKDIKTWAKTTYNYDYGLKRIYIAYGKPDNVDNNLLIIRPELDKNAKPFEDETNASLLKILSDYKIDKFFITPRFIVPKEVVTKNDIKKYSLFINILCEILNPKLIVVLGENSVFSFFKRTSILRDTHGSIIGSSKLGIPIVLTYEPLYYKERSEYEDPSFKNFILNNDWTIISTLYREKIK